MVSYIQKSYTNRGHYTLEILIPRGLFLSASDYETCLAFDLVIEYIKKDN